MITLNVFFIHVLVKVAVIMSKGIRTAQLTKFKFKPVFGFTSSVAYLFSIVE